MATDYSRRASVQIMVRLEPHEAELIKRVIPAGSRRAVVASLLMDYARTLEAQMPKEDAAAA